MVAITLTPMYSLVVWTFVMAISFVAFIGTLYVGLAWFDRINKTQMMVFALSGLIYLSLSRYCFDHVLHGFKTLLSESLSASDPISDRMFLIGVALEMFSLLCIQLSFSAPEPSADASREASNS